MTLAGTYLDPQLVLFIEDDQFQSPIFDELLHETVAKGSTIALELKEFLDTMDRKRHEAPDVPTEAFRAIDPEYGPTCDHGLPIDATCTYCLEGLAPNDPRAANTIIIATREARQGKVYGKTQRERRPWWQKLLDWLALMEETKVKGK